MISKHFNLIKSKNPNKKLLKVYVDTFGFASVSILSSNVAWACKVRKNNQVVLLQPSINLSINFISLFCVVSLGLESPALHCK